MQTTIFYKDTGFTAKHSKNAIIASDVKLTDLFELAQNYDSYKDFVADNPKLATLINYFKTEIQEVCFPKNDYINM